MSFESRAEIEQNLKDAGCNEGTIKQFFQYEDKNWENEQITLLEKHRENLLNQIHNKEKKIYCLDYLIFQIKKKQDSRGISKSQQARQ